MRLAYNILFYIAFALSAPFYFFKMWKRGNWQKGFAQRFGYFGSNIKQAISNRHVIWFHAVSVGEVNLCTQLISHLEPRIPSAKLVVSTTTSTGMGELQKKLPNYVEKIYYPVDARGAVFRALATFQPVAVILVEAEIWPNFLWRAAAMHVPVMLVNARLSDRSFRGYRRFGFLFRPLFSSMAGIGCQNDADAARLRELGARPEAVRVVGNLKYDAAKLEDRKPLNVRALFDQVGIPRDALILLGGSTHSGEEAILASLFLKLRKDFPNLVLVLVPRHFERGKEVGGELEKLNVRFAYRSEITSSTRMQPGTVDCLLVNSTGELKFFYEFADLVFIGKSLTAEGGQNPLEPASLGKAMIMGPHMENFPAVMEALKEGAGAVQVADAVELEIKVRELLSNPQERERLGRNAVEVIRKNSGAIEKTIEMILEHLRSQEVFVKEK